MRALLTEIVHTLSASPAIAADGGDAAAPVHADHEAREILAVLMDVTPGDVARQADAVVASDLAVRARAVAARRATGEPLAYCLGSAAFRQLVLRVDRRVLIPRPETEVVVEEALRLGAGSVGGIAVDIGTGSGAIALALATEGRFGRVIATDVSPEALAVASANGAALSTGDTTLEFRLGADFDPIKGIKACLIISNPPYIALGEASALPASVRDWEPALALFADAGGMARYDALLAGAPAHLVPGGWLVLEVDSQRAQETARRAAATGHFTGVRLVRDLTGRERVLVAQLANTSGAT